MLKEDDNTPLFYDMICRFLEQEANPHYDAWEAAGQVPREFWLKLGEAGMLAIDLAEEYGGSAADFGITQLVLEEISRRGFGGLASAYNIHANIVIPYVEHLASAEQKQQWLPRMATGEVMSAIAMTEPGAGSD